MHELNEFLIRDRLVPADLKTRVIYHYTSAAGLIGILGSGSVRGTNATFLNDASEITYGLSVCLSVLEEEQSARTSAVERALLKRVLDRLRLDASPHDVYIASFSARRDLLSQWRGYGSADGRFCIGLQLSQFSERDILRLPQRVEYEPREQRALVRRAISIARERASQEADDEQQGRERSIDLSFYLRRLMCWLKHSGFREEEEWRSVAMRDDDEFVLGFEAVRGLPRPYITLLSGCRTSRRLPVVEICIGPAERREIATQAVRLLLAHHGYNGAAVTQTDIPFTP